MCLGRPGCFWGFWGAFEGVFGEVNSDETGGWRLVASDYPVSDF